MATILIVEDDETILLGIREALEIENFIVFQAVSIKEAKQKFDDNIDLIILDMNLPDGLGYEFCKYVKSLKDTPIIFLTVRDSETDIIKGFDMGADDYITKPFKLKVLISHITAVLKRTTKQQLHKNIICCSDIKIYKLETKVYKGEQELNITYGEYKLLLILFENKNQTITRNLLLEKLWDIDSEYVNDNTLTVNIKRLREKIEDDSQFPKIIKTIRGIGYKAVDKDE